MCESVDENDQPVGATNVFITDTPVIYCSFKVSNAPPDTNVKAEWIYIGGEEDITPGLIDEASTIIDESGYYFAALPLPSGYVWPTGSYKVVLYIDGKEAVSVPFTVQ